jgi:hypothetical protein
MATTHSKPEPMNATNHHSKVRTSLRFGDPLFVAGGAVSGKLEMECKTDKGLGIGVIMVELFAIEGTALLSILILLWLSYARTYFQGPFRHTDFSA